jgi:hypothetical protein
VDQRGATAPRKGAVVTKITLTKAVRAGVEGPGSHVDHYSDAVASPHLTLGNLGEHEHRLADYFTKIARQMGPKFNAKGSIHLSTPGWIAMGLVYHDLYHGNLTVDLGEAERDQFISRIGQINWSPSNPEFLRFLGTAATDKNTGNHATDDETGAPVLRMFGGSKAFYNLAGYIRYKIGLTPLLKEAQFGNPDNFEVILGEERVAA